MKQLLAIFFFAFLIGCSESTDKIEESTPKFEDVILYYNNGNIFCSGKHKVENNYSKIRIGDWKFYNANGKIEYEMNYNEKGGKVSEKRYFEDGKIKYDDQFDGEGVLVSGKSYNKDGKIIETIIENEDTYLKTTYYLNGNIAEEYLETKVAEKDEDGYEITNQKSIVREYYPSGNIREQSELLDNKPNGEKKIWDSTGVLLITVKYDDGIIITNDKK